jgi:hypothetical protein
VPVSPRKHRWSHNRRWRGRDAHSPQIHQVSMTLAVWALCQVLAFAQELEPSLHIVMGEGGIAVRTSGFPATVPTSRAVISELMLPLELPDVMRPLVEQMLRTSPTFRRQCARLSEASVTVVVRLDPGIDLTKVIAITTIDVREGQVRSVRTHLGVLAPQYLAHEIEHVLEQLDGIDLRRALKSGLHGAHQVSPGAVETTRAVATGLLVAQEICRSMR